MSGSEGTRQGKDVSIVLCGQAGQGVQTVEYLLTRILKLAGYHVFATKEYMSRVRGGANSTTIRVSGQRVSALVSRMDILVALNEDAVAHVAEGGVLKWYVGTAGGEYVRVDVDAFLDGPGAESYIVGVGVGNGRRFLDHRTVQHHVKGDSQSRIHFGTLLMEESNSIYR